jgi:PilZ domain-containing protein
MVSQVRHEVIDRRFQETGQVLWGSLAGSRRGTINGDEQFVSEMDFTESGQQGQTSRLPSEGLTPMPLDPRLGGRMERRLPIIVVVRLAQVEPADSDREERTYTDNISTRGARVFSRYPWQAGERVMVTPLREETASGNVVYCQTLSDGRYGVGVKFQGDLVMWSVIRRFDGVQISSPAKSESSTSGSEVTPQGGTDVPCDKSEDIAKK